MLLKKWGLLLCGIVLFLPNLVRAAEQKALGLVDTSTNIKPTSSKNKFILITDPTLAASPTGNDPTQLIPTNGSLSDYFDPTQFTLATDPSTGTFDLGGSVAGYSPFHVSSFTVQSLYGSLTVSDNGEGGDNYSTSGEFDSSQLTGYVTHIDFYLPADSASQAQTSDQDQNFYQIYLDGLTPNSADGYAMTEALSGDFVTFGPSTGSTGQTSETVTFGNIVPSAVPEVSSAGFLAFVGVTLFLRRRREQLGERASST
jgi:hypothetical protein